ncbi:3-dehydroquinate synthase [Mariniphaga sediminis]|uniref:3-dehydroquinate synthase n=1 Tax=Mariniphaga sediminis TaxID=1628158 RepID=UPI003568B246
MGNSKIYSKIIYTTSPENELNQWIDKYEKGKVFIATEENVAQLWMPQFNSFLDKHFIRKVVVTSGEKNKKLNSVAEIWEFLSKNGADRKSLLINLGGGMLTDLAGFAASTFKRGIDFLNIPTTLLSQVDASVGGKTGINFNGLKNEIGTFKEPVAVIINSRFLQTIDPENFLSGFAEMIKHGLIKSPAHLEELENFNLKKIDYQNLQEIIRHSVEVKEYFVGHDPTEKNIRKALNFGHTVGHAFESFGMGQKNQALHGYNVAWGMIVELYLSVKECGLNEKECTKITNWLLSIYGKMNIEKDDFERLYELMTHDKKNEAGRINFTLLPEIGRIEINQHCNKELIFDALEYFRTIQ